MTLREKILKTFVVTIREVNTHGGVKEFFKKYPVGGLYYSEGAVLTDENGVEMGTAMSHEKMLECKAAAKDDEPRRPSGGKCGHLRYTSGLSTPISGRLR